MTAARRAATLSLAAALLLGAAGIASAEIRTSLSQAKVAEGDTFVLNLQADGTAQGAAPDLAPLQQDFEVLGTSQSTSVEVINGKVSQSAGWAITLSPRATGTLTVPAVTIGAEASRPQTIEVVDAASLPRASLADSGIEVEMSVEPGTYYVQQEIPLKLRILSSADLRSASLSEPVSPDAIITKTGEDRTSRVTMGGKPVTVIERDYLVKPQKSGTLTLPPVTLRATVPDPDAARRSPFGTMGDPFQRMRDRFNMSMPGFSMPGFDDPFGMFDRGREITARSGPVTLDIAARPASATGWFLPAKEVELRAAWEPAEPDFKAGEAAQRIVQIVALGASKEQLPDLEFADVDGAAVYVERVDDRSRDTGQGTEAIKQYTLSVIPTRGGEVTLPAIEVNWLDADTGEEEVATLPAETLVVSGPAAQPATETSPAPAATAADSGAGLLSGLSDRVLAGIAGGAALVLLAAIALAVRSTRRKARLSRTGKDGETAIRATRPTAEATAAMAAARRAEAAGSVRQACRRKDARAAFGALTGWFRAVGATPQTLDAPGADRLREAMRELELRLYGPAEATAWDPRPLLTAFDGVCGALDADNRPARPVGDLPPLYPNSRAA